MASPVSVTDTPPHRPPQRMTRRGEEKRALILSTAADMFLEHGYDGVSLDDIVKACGGSKTNVYSYFGGKDGLFVAVVERLCDRFLEKTEKGVDVSRCDAAQGLDKIAHSFLQSLLDERHLAFLRLIFAESRRFPALGNAWYTRGPAATCAYVAAFLGSQQARGTRLSASPEVSARLFHGMVLASVLHRTLATGMRPAEAEIDALVRDAIAVIVPAVDAGQPSAGPRKQ
ncbi:TetR/AcrR family transcriptional regulator [Cupriavidus oxalaticus]|uniref:TetR/AcrR family transcriptional regulator n=2 Tax=Cupriavidus oxalaticus TaxID=96344 RepID=A0A5P3VJW7_9BURK|nr:TetR/AcrR family transcriptional regulator [Cupriavidus oxalaticus]QEZ46530.1 TetR/AcrR family transcriptional regulator [Cupriavidus oxalaticus]QRQ85997.1 TetR/AcrR family transcriptional regulator [Cupriavidus oxalaticus]QRQ95676.1 TetR/AcrR family transcriptional regulator [Cupriavidus oxalaticus]